MTNTTAITDFSGEYAFLSSDFRFDIPIGFGDYLFHNVSQAFEAAKTSDKLARARIAQASSPLIARQISRMSEKETDWKNIQLSIMQNLVERKFTRNLPLLRRLLDTKAAELINGGQGNYLQDTYWGVVWGSSGQGRVGENQLGRLIMKVRQKYQYTYRTSDGGCIDCDE